MLSALVATNVFHGTSACTLVGLVDIMGSQIEILLYLFGAFPLT